jgi:hypothetical protein
MHFLLTGFALLISWSLSFAQDSNQTYQQQADRMQLQRLQQELEISRMQAQTESLRRDTERINAEMRQLDAEAKQSKPESIFEIMARKNAAKEAEQKAQEAAAAAEEEKQIEAAKSADLAYLCLAIALPLAMSFYLVNKVKKGMEMKREEKFGILLMIFCALAGLGVIAISDGWVPRFDALQNIMLTLRFRLLLEGESIYSSATIDVPTKYILLSLICVSAYGFTTYLGITPVAMKKMQAAPEPSEQKSEN